MASITGFNFSSWNTLVIDGHDVEAVCKAFYEAKTTKGRPTAILAKTYKGKGVEGMVIARCTKRSCDIVFVEMKVV